MSETALQSHRLGRAPPFFFPTDPVLDLLPAIDYRLVTALKISVAGAGVLLLAWGAWLRAHGPDKTFRRTRDGAESVDREIGGAVTEPGWDAVLLAGFGGPEIGELSTGASANSSGVVPGSSARTKTLLSARATVAWWAPSA